MKDTSYFDRLLPGRDIAPNLYFARPDELAKLLETGEHVDFTDYKNACAELDISLRNASPAFRSNVLSLGNGLSHLDFWDLTESLSWYSGNPNQGIRDQLLVSTQWLADSLHRHERGEAEPRFSDRT